MNKKRELIKKCIACAAALLLAANATAVYSADTARAAKVVDLAGTVSVLKAGGEKAFNAFKGMSLSQGDSIVTAKSAWVELEIDDYKLVKITENTRLSISELTGSAGAGDDRTGLQLWFGKVWTNIKEALNVQSRYEIRTPKTVMGVRGTQFYASMANGNTVIAVFEGRVLAITYTSERRPDGTMLEQAIQAYIDQNQQTVIDEASLGEAEITVAPISLEDIDPGILVEILQTPQGISEAILNQTIAILNQKINEIPPYVLVDLLRNTVNLPPDLRQNANNSLTDRAGEIDPDTLQDILNNPQGIDQNTLDGIRKEAASRPPAGNGGSQGNTGMIPDPGQGGSPSPGSGSDSGSDSDSPSDRTIAVTGVTVTPETATLTVGQTRQLTATVLPATATNRSVQWTSSDTAVATVSSTGLVEAKGVGEAYIRAITVDGGRQASCHVTVSNILGAGEYISAYRVGNVVSVSGRINGTGSIGVSVLNGSSTISADINEHYFSGTGTDFFYKASVNTDNILTYKITTYTGSVTRTITGSIAWVKSVSLFRPGESSYVEVGGQVKSPDNKVKLTLEKDNGSGARTVYRPLSDNWNINWIDISEGYFEGQVLSNLGSLPDGTYDVVLSFNQVNSSDYFGVVVGRVEIDGGSISGVTVNEW